MLTKLVMLSCGLAILGACGGGGVKPATKALPTAHAPAKQASPGTSGLPGLDWGASADAVHALYSDAKAGGDGLVASASVEGRPATLSFTLTGGHLARVAVAWSDPFASMGECAKTWTSLRAGVDGRLGASQSDNLAAYWNTASASVTIACNPGDGEAATLSGVYEPRAAQ